jgi:group I intron endonuclease
MRKKGNPGVYIIQNKVNNKAYVGASKDTYNRLCDHKVMLRGNSHHNIHLQSAFNKYREENFIFDVLEDCDEQLIYSQENYWCKMLNTHDRKYGYNVDPTAPDGKCAVSDETKVKMSASASKRPVVVYTIYGDFYKEFSDLYKCAEEFDTVAPNVHRKMNNIPKKTLIDSKSSMFMFMDKNISVEHVKQWYDDVFLKISNSKGPYSVYTCFGTLIGNASSADISKALGVRLSCISAAANRETYLKGLKFIRCK